MLNICFKLLLLLTFCNVHKDRSKFPSNFNQVQTAEIVSFHDITIITNDGNDNDNNHCFCFDYTYFIIALLLIQSA